MTPREQARIQPLLKAHAFLGGLPDAVLDGMIQRGQMRAYKKGEIVFQRGDPGDSLMLLVTGGIKLSLVSARAKEVVLHFVGAGELFGQISAFDGEPRTSAAVALEDSEVFIAHTRDFLPAVVGSPATAVAVVRHLCGRVRNRVSLFEDQTFDMRARLARGLVRLANQLGQRRKDGIHLELAATQEELGNYLGLARANVSRLLGELKSLEVIKSNGPRIVIADERRLAEIAEAEPLE